MRPLLERLGGLLPATIALAIPTVWVPFAVDSFILPRAGIVLGGACLGVGVALLTPGGPSLGRVRWPLLAAAAGAALAFVTSVSWPLSFAGAYTRYESLPVRLAYLGLFAMSVWLLRSSRLRGWVVAAFVWGTAVACIEALFQLAGHAAYRPDGNLGNANVLAALIAMALPLAIDRGVRGGTFVVAWWMGAALLGGGLVATTSRSGALGALVGCLALAVLALRGKWFARAALASAAITAGAVALILVSPLRLLNDDPAALRLHIWRDGLNMLAARPLTGWGEDSTGLAFGAFWSGDWSGVALDRIHSGPLDIAVTQGVIGLAALTWVLVVLFRGAWRQRFTPDVGALTAACIGYTVWVFFNFDWAPATGAFWLLAGVAWSAVRDAEVGGEQAASPLAQVNATAPVARAGLAIAAALAAVGLAVMPVLADVWYYQGRADLSIIADPLQARYHWYLGDGFVAAGSLQRGADELRRAAQLGETDPSLYVDLGDQELRLGRVALARADYRKALAIDPYFRPARQRLATT